MTHPLPTEPTFPSETSQLSQWLGPRPKATDEQAIDAFSKVKAVDFEPYKGEWGKPEQEAAIELLCRMCNMQPEQVTEGTRKSLKVASRYLLNNVTTAEAQGAIGRMDAKSADWYHKHGQPMSAAKWIVNEVSRMKSEQAREANGYLGWEQEQLPTAADTEKHKRYLGWLEP